VRAPGRGGGVRGRRGCRPAPERVTRRGSRGGRRPARSSRP
jgi:hypothetical protein